MTYDILDRTPEEIRHDTAKLALGDLALKAYIDSESLRCMADEIDHLTYERDVEREASNMLGEEVRELRAIVSSVEAQVAKWEAGLDEFRPATEVGTSGASVLAAAAREIRTALEATR